MPRGLPGMTTRGRSMPVRLATVAKPGLQVDDHPAREHPAHVGVEHRAAAEREHAAARAERLKAAGDRAPLELAEDLLAVVDEDVADRLVGRLGDERVGVRERDAEPAASSAPTLDLPAVGGPTSTTPAVASSRCGYARHRRRRRHRCIAGIRDAHEITSDFR